MRRILAITITLSTLLMFLSGCMTIQSPSENDGEQITLNSEEKEIDNQPIKRIEDKVVSGFSEYLDNINIVAGLSQSDFITKVEQYKYNGTPVLDAVIALHYDRESGGGWMATGDLFGFHNDYTVTEDEKYANYSTRIFTKVQLEGLVLPQGIELGESLEDVFKKTGIELSIYSGFTPDKNSDIHMTLYRNGESSLVLKDLRQSKDPVDYEYPCWLVFTEKTDIQQTDGKTTTVERVISLGFLGDVLSLAEISVNEMRER